MTSKRRARALVLVASAGLIASACGASSDSSATQSSANPSSGGDTSITVAADSSSAAPEDAPEILRFTSPLVGGGELDAAELSGTPTAFWFWSPT